MRLWCADSHANRIAGPSSAKGRQRVIVLQQSDAPRGVATLALDIGAELVKRKTTFSPYFSERFLTNAAPDGARYITRSRVTEPINRIELWELSEQG